MNARLKTLLESAETRLAPAEQSALADLLEAFVANRDSAADFSRAELDHLRQVDAEPFVEADPVALAALFARRG